HDEASRRQIEQLARGAEPLLQLVADGCERLGALHELFFGHFQLFEGRHQNRRELRFALYRSLPDRCGLRTQKVRGVLQQDLSLLREGREEVVLADEIVSHGDARNPGSLASAASVAARASITYSLSM